MITPENPKEIIQQLTDQALNISAVKLKEKGPISALEATGLAFIRAGREVVLFSLSRLTNEGSTAGDLNEYMVRMDQKEISHFLLGISSITLGSTVLAAESTISHGYRDEYYTAPFNEALIGTPIPPEPSLTLQDRLKQERGDSDYSGEETTKITKIAVADKSLALLFGEPEERKEPRGLNINLLLEEIAYTNRYLPQITRLQLEGRSPSIRIAFRLLVPIYEEVIRKVTEATRPASEFKRRSVEDWLKEIPYDIYQEVFEN